MAKKDYDKTLTRLIGILTTLSQREFCNAKEFALEYNVTPRTIQKDIYERLKSFPIEKNSDGKFKFIDGFSLDKSMLKTEEMILLSLSLAQFCSTDYFNDTSNTILNKLLYPKFCNPYFINHGSMEDININSKIHKKLRRAIENRQIVLIGFDNKSIEVEPYKLANFDGFWYLFAKETNTAKIKTYRLYKINDVKESSKRYETSYRQIDSILENVHSAWFEDGEAYEIVIKVYQNIAHFFKYKKFLQSQKIVKEYENGDLLVSFEVTHDEDIDNIIKSWLPDIEVCSPKSYRDEIERELRKYLEKISKKKKCK